MSLLAAYLDAHREDEKAKRTMARAERLFDRLSRTLGDDEAYRVAGMNLADRRSLESAYRLRQAGFALVYPHLRAGWISRGFISALGIILCCEGLPAAANQNRRRRVSER